MSQWMAPNNVNGFKREYTGKVLEGAEGVGQPTACSRAQEKS